MQSVNVSVSGENVPLMKIARHSFVHVAVIV